MRSSTGVGQRQRSPRTWRRRSPPARAGIRVRRTVTTCTWPLSRVAFRRGVRPTNSPAARYCAAATGWTEAGTPCSCGEHNSLRRQARPGGGTTAMAQVGWHLRYRSGLDRRRLAAVRLVIPAVPTNVTTDGIACRDLLAEQTAAARERPAPAAGCLERPPAARPTASRRRCPAVADC